MKMKLYNWGRKYILTFLVAIIMIFIMSGCVECSDDKKNIENNIGRNNNTSSKLNEITNNNTYIDNTNTEVNENNTNNNIQINEVDNNYDNNQNILENTNLTMHEDNNIYENNTEIKIENNSSEKTAEDIANDTLEADISRNYGTIEEDNQELIKEAENIDEKQTSSTESDWERDISDFEPAEMITIELENQKEFLYDPITEIPSHIKLAFIVNDEDARIDFEIINPDQEVIYTANSRDHLFHNFIADTKGEYVFALDSRGFKDKIKVTFAIHQGNSTNTHLSHDNLQVIWDKINFINKSLKSSRFTASLLSKKYDSHFEYAKKYNMHITFMSIIETTFLILIFFLQLFYIKRLASKLN